MGHHINIREDVRRLIDTQAGVLTRRQAMSGGLTDKALSALIRDERFVRGPRGVYLRAFEPEPFDQRLWVGHLLAGEYSAIGGAAALAKRGVGLPPDTVQIVVPLALERRLPEPYFRLRDGRGRLVHRRGTLPLIRTEDAILDESAAHCLERFVGRVTDATRMGLTNPKQVAKVLHLRERHRDKSLLLEVLADLQGIESNLEFIYRRDVERAHGLPAALRQVRHGRSRFDVVYEPFGVVVEVDGRRGHIDNRFRDYARDNGRTEQGILTFRYGSYDIRGIPCKLARQVGGALVLRGWTGRVSACQHCVGG